jgi:hypothetical protein
MVDIQNAFTFYQHCRSTEINFLLVRQCNKNSMAPSEIRQLPHHQRAILMTGRLLCILIYFTRAENERKIYRRNDKNKNEFENMILACTNVT